MTPSGVGHFLESTAQQWRHNLEYAVRTCQVAARRMVAAGTTVRR